MGEWCCPFFLKKPKEENGKPTESSPLISDKPDNGKPTYTDSRSPHDETNANSIANPILDRPQPAPQHVTRPERRSEMVERIEMKPLEVKKVDEIFEKFEKIFDQFYQCQCDVQRDVKTFEKAFHTAGDFQACLVQFREQLKGERVVIRRLALKFPKAAKSVSDATRALTSIFKAYEDLEKLSVKVIKMGIECVEGAMSLDMSEIAGEEFGGKGYDFGKSPERIKIMRANLKEIKKAPKIVEDFFEYASGIVMDVIKELGEERNKEELKNRREKVVADLKKLRERLEEVANPAPPKEIHFTSLGIADVDRLFNDVAKLVNPVVKLSNDMFNARNRLENAAKAVSEFRDDPSKAFDDYLEELKKRLRKGKVNMVISVNGNHVEVEKVEGLEPKATQDMQAGCNGVLKSGKELRDLTPDSIQELIKLSKDILNLSVKDIKDHIKNLKDLKSKTTALKDNAKKAKKIPDDLKYFFNFAVNLIMDILLLVRTEKEEIEESQASG